MKILRLHIVRLLLMTLVVLPAATSCYNYDEEEIISNSNQYINITISVRTGQYLATRGLPNGGEDGDGREKGIDTRENEVEGVTLIFYQDAANTTAGVNASADNADATTIDYAVYYKVTRDDSHASTHPTGHTDEVFYTTGDKELTAPLSSDNKYRLLVVANANLTGSITAGTTTLAQVRDMVLSSVYTGSGKGTDASKFVMTSADDTELTFNSYTDDKVNNRRIFNFDNIHIERLAARIDYWAKGAEYSDAYDHKGYVYSVGSSTDKFVLTSIEPFNLNTGNEYLFKRTNDATNPYLANETTTNWVLDPYTKTAAAHPDYISNSLTSVAAKTDALDISMETMQSSKITVDSKDDIILAYPKENTISATTPYYYYATGLAFEGYYYRNGATTGGERRVYYHFIRHQGEQNNAYDALNADQLEAFVKSTTIGGSGTAMNFGIVRNNIYRVSIESISPEAGTIKIKIEEKHWRHVDHPVIYL